MHTLNSYSDSPYVAFSAGLGVLAIIFVILFALPDEQGPSTSADAAAVESRRSSGDALADNRAGDDRLGKTAGVLGDIHELTEHGLQVTLPRGWRRIEALSGNTILKLARVDTFGKEARIVIVTFVAEEPVDLSTISRDDHIRALKAGSMLGEKVSVIDVGRTQLSGVHALWGKTHRNLPSRGSTHEYTYEFAREYKGIPKAFTIRLTSYGSEAWFKTNAAVFDRFIK